MYAWFQRFSFTSFWIEIFTIKVNVFQLTTGPQINFLLPTHTSNRMFRTGMFNVKSEFNLPKNVLLNKYLFSEIKQIFDKVNTDFTDCMTSWTKSDSKHVSIVIETN